MQDMAHVGHNMDHMNIQDGGGMQHRLKEAILHKLRPKEREISERIRGALRGQPIEEVLRRFASDGGKNAQYITEEDLLIGVSKLNANLNLGDLKDFINGVKQASGI